MPWWVRVGVETVRELNYWRIHGSALIAQQKAREVLHGSDSDRRESALAMFEAQTFTRRHRNVEWATTWAAINDVFCMELESVLGSCDENDRVNVTGILAIVSSRRRDFPLDEASEALAAAKRQSILMV
jgi:hypothetical protein